MSRSTTRTFEAGIDALLYLLAVIVAIRVVADRASDWPVAAALTVAVAVAYAAGTVRRRRVGHDAIVWFAVVTALWVGLIGVDLSGVFIGFALFFVALDRFEHRPGIVIVALFTAAILVSEAVHQPSLGIAGAIGPLIGAAVAVAVVLGYRSLERENEHRRSLNEELHRTRGELAAAEHSRGVLEERERLAREIHDTVAQGLASIVIMLSATETELASGDEGAALDHVRQARDTARHDLDEVRRFVRDLAPPDLNERTLAEALERLCHGATEPGALKVTFTTSGSPQPIPPPYEVALYRVAQSAIGNITQHAGARQGRVTLTFMPDSVTLDVYDDGRGFEPEPPRPAPSGTGGGFGLIAMRQRVDALGGTFTIETERAHGTTIAASLPLDPSLPASSGPP